MKNTSCLLVFLCILFNAYSQDYDLVVTTKGDSIACRIDSVTDASIYFEMKHNNHWVHTNISRDEVIEYKYDAIFKVMVAFKPGTSYIESVYNENDANLMKAQTLQRSGKIVTIAGASILGATFLTLIVFGEHWGFEGVAVAIFGGLAGLGTMAVGVPMIIIGKERAKKTNSFKNTAFNSITIGLKPCAQYNLITQNYQPGLTLRIRF
ncbi:MAG: hypothetical protein JXA61_00080 [Bacteroidales bacterium]|nr:hypothetical protein [Bacteroidales bacterium]